MFRRGVGGDTFRSSHIATRPARLAQPTPPKDKPKKTTQKHPNPQTQIFCRAELPSKPHPIEKDDYRPPSRNQCRRVSGVFGLRCFWGLWCYSVGVVGWCSGANWSLELNGLTRLLVSGAKGSPELCVFGCGVVWCRGGCLN